MQRSRRTVSASSPFPPTGTGFRARREGRSPPRSRCHEQARDAPNHTPILCRLRDQFAKAELHRQLIRSKTPATTLDEVHNRERVAEQLGQAGTPSSTQYSLQAGSDRYDQVGGVTLQYDERGNVRFDGHHYFVYDALARLAEVYEIQSDRQQAGAGGVTETISSAARRSRCRISVRCVRRAKCDSTIRVAHRSNLFQVECTTTCIILVELSS